MEKNPKREVRRFDWFTSIDIKLLSDKGKEPEQSDPQAIGYDLYVPNDTLIPAHARIVVPMDFAIKLPTTIEAKIEPRSGFSAKGIEGYGVKKYWIRTFFGLLPWKRTEVGTHRYDADVLVGKIDPGYRGNVGVIIRNNDEAFVLKAGTRVAQMTFYRTVHPRYFVRKEELTGVDRGGGFGHSNK